MFRSGPNIAWKFGILPIIRGRQERQLLASFEIAPLNAGLFAPPATVVSAATDRAAFGQLLGSMPDRVADADGTRSPGMPVLGGADDPTAQSAADPRRAVASIRSGMPAAACTGQPLAQSIADPSSTSPGPSPNSDQAVKRTHGRKADRSPVVQVAAANGNTMDPVPTSSTAPLVPEINLETGAYLVSAGTDANALVSQAGAKMIATASSSQDSGPHANPRPTASLHIEPNERSPVEPGSVAPGAAIPPTQAGVLPPVVGPLAVEPAAAPRLSASPKPASKGVTGSVAVGSNQREASSVSQTVNSDDDAAVTGSDASSQSVRPIFPSSVAAPHGGAVSTPPELPLSQRPGEPVLACAAPTATDREAGPHSTDAAPSAPSTVPVPELVLIPTEDSLQRSRTTATADTPTYGGIADAPTAQIAPALLTLVKVGLGNRQISVQLRPSDLGAIQIRIQRAASGTTRIDISADKPETLRALQRDQGTLHRTLDDASIPIAGRTISFHPIHPPAQSSTGPASGHGSGPDALAGRSKNANSSTGDPTSGGRGGRYIAGVRDRRSGERMPGVPVGSAAEAEPRIYRIGLNITA
jgi:hypothetical protein